MGFLDKFWDETLAGPKPDSGLGRLRKSDTFSAARSTDRPPPLEIPGNEIPITRCITMLRSSSSPVSPSPPASPADSSTPTSPFSPSAPGENFKKFTRRKPMGESQISDAESKGSYDWIVMQTVLDR